MKIRKAVIPAAGLGTRVLPASKAVPKEMLPIVDKPALQYIVEEAARSGIEDILIVTNRGKTVMEDHFDRSPELEQKLLDSGKEELYQQMKEISQLANITYIRQTETKGLGHAVYKAKSFVGDEPFAILYGDDVVIGEVPACGELCRAYEKYGLGVVGIKPVTREQIVKYCTLDLTPAEEARVYRVHKMIEKPREDQILSLYSILGRCVLPPEIFSILEQTPPGAGGEIQLTDAMQALCARRGMMAVEYQSTRYDMGNKLGIMKAIVETGLSHPEIGGEFRDYLKNLVKNLE